MTMYSTVSKREKFHLITKWMSGGGQTHKPYQIQVE